MHDARSSREATMTRHAYEFGTPDSAARVRASFARQGAMATLGASLDAVEPGYCAISLAPRPEVSQQHGYVHAGVVSAIVDTAGGYAGFSLFPATASVLTVEFKVNLLAPAEGERFLARGRVVRAGRTLSVCTGEVTAFRGAEEKTVALMTATVMTVQERAELSD